MAAAHGPDPGQLINAITSDPARWDFFLALRSLECAHPAQPRIGRSRSLREDPLRFGQFLSLGFATSALEKPQIRGETRKLLVRFTGLTGPHGPMPLRLTEFIRNRLTGVFDSDIRGTRADLSGSQSAASPRDATLAAFLDVFHHRIISLFYRAWAVAQKTADFDRAEDRSFAEWIATSFGCGDPAFDGTDGIPLWRKLPFAGFLSSGTRHPGGLEGLLREFFRLPVILNPLAGHWVDLPPEQHCRLGESRHTAALGQSCIVGARVWDRQLKFTLRIGPMGYQRFRSFLPGGESHRLLHDWVAFYTRREFFWEASIVLKKEEVPAIQLGAAGALGRTGWLRSQQMTEDVDSYCVKGGGLSPADNT